MANKQVTKSVVKKQVEVKEKESPEVDVPAISMLLYGKAGTGKSVFVNTFPKALIFDFDNSHKMYKRAFPENGYISGPQKLKTKDGEEVNVSMIQALQMSIEKIKAGTFKHKTLVIDSLTNLENAAVSFARGLDEKNWHRTLYTQDGRKLTYDSWGNISGSTISMLIELRKYDVNVIVITQVDTKQVDGSEKQYPQLIGKGQNEALHFPDFVGYMTKSEGSKGIERYLHLNSLTSDDFVAKARLIQGEVQPIKNPHYKDIAKLVAVQDVKLDFSK